MWFTSSNVPISLVAPTTPLSPIKTPVSRFLEAQGSPRVWKKQISFSEEDEVVRDIGDSPFNTGSIYSAPSMLSIHSDVGTSKHEDDVRCKRTRNITHVTYHVITACIEVESN